VALSLHVDNITGIERGLLGGAFHVGIVPTHRSSKALQYADLFGETMLLYCGVGNPLFTGNQESLTWAQIRKMPFAGLGYHSPNMQLSHRERLNRAATGFDQEAIATLVLSGPVCRLPTRPLRRQLRQTPVVARRAPGTLSIYLPVCRGHAPLPRAVTCSPRICEVSAGRARTQSRDRLESSEAPSLQTRSRPISHSPTSRTSSSADSNSGCAQKVAITVTPMVRG
jgi:hypothetical protein